MVFGYISKDTAKGGTAEGCGTASGTPKLCDIEALTKIQKIDFFNKDEDVVFYLYKQTPTKYLIPYYIEGLESIPIVKSGVQKCDVKYTSTIQLRSGHQTDCVNTVLDAIRKGGDKHTSGILTLTTASGKTVIALSLIYALKSRAIVIVNKSDSVFQWKERINAFLPNARVGIIQGTKLEIDPEKYDICIGMIQTISSNKNIKMDTLQNFPTCILDEVHNMCTQVYSNGFFKITSKYQFGMTATLERNDTLHKVIHAFLGDIMYTNLGDNSVLKQVSNVQIHVKSGCWKDCTEVHTFYRNGKTELNHSKIITDLAMSTERSDYILEQIVTLLKNSECKILCMSERKDQLKYFHKILGSEVSGLYIGNMKSEEYTRSQGKRVILGIYKIVCENFDKDDINTLIFCTPRSSIIQSIGRIYRKKHLNYTPLIVDFEDTFCSRFSNQQKTRTKIYKTHISNPKIDKVFI
jgi:superfamily II DNA or RNA helicase